MELGQSLHGWTCGVPREGLSLAQPVGALRNGAYLRPPPGRLSPRLVLHNHPSRRQQVPNPIRLRKILPLPRGNPSLDQPVNLRIRKGRRTPAGPRGPCAT